MQNLLRNSNFYKPRTGQFETTWYTPLNPDGQPFYTTPWYNNIIVPDGWECYGEHSTEFRPPWDPANTNGRVPFEGKLTEAIMNADGTSVLQRTFPERWYGDNRSWCQFKSFMISWGGLYQQVTVAAGRRYRASAAAMGWNTGAEYGWKPLCSWGCGCAPFAMLWDEIRSQYSGQTADALEALRFRVGVDPTGGTNPYAATIVWSPAWAVYNTWQLIDTPEVVAQGDAITVFLDGEARLPSQNNDRYWAAPALWPVEEQDPEEPDEQDEPRVWMVPPGLHLTTGDSGASDEARALYAQLKAEFPKATEAQLAQALPPIKVYGRPELAATLQLFFAINPYWPTTFRLSGIDGVAINVEGPSLDPDPVTAAQRYWAAIAPHVKAHVDRRTLLELINEQDPVGVEGHRKLALFMKEVARLALVDGYEVGLFSYSMGVPEWSEIKAVVETGALDGLNAALCLHEYAFPLDDGFGGPGIPGYTGDASDKGPLAFRYRYWIEALHQVGNWTTSIAITEMNTAAALDKMTPAEWEAQVRWYLTEAAKDPEVVEVDLFGWGSLGGSWKGFDIRQVRERWRAIALDAARGILTHKPEEPEEPDICPRPREGWGDRITVLVHFDAPTAAFLEAAAWADAPERRHDVDRSWDHAWWSPGVVRNTILLWQDVPGRFDPEFVREWGWTYYPEMVPSTTIGEVGPGAGSLAPLEGYRSYAQRNPAWGSIHLGNTGYTMHSSGCFVTAYCDALSKDCPDLTPGRLVAWLNANGGFDATGNLYVARPFDMPEVAAHFRFVKYWRWDSAGAQCDLSVIRRLLAQGPVVVKIDFVPETAKIDSHAVVLTRANGAGDFWMFDPWTAGNDSAPVETSLMATYGAGRTLETAIFTAVEMARVSPSPTPEHETWIGVNDPLNQGAAAWLLSEGRKGLAVIPWFVATTPAPLKLPAGAGAGIRVVGNLRLSYASDNGGTGTLPKPGTPAWQPFIDAAVATIQQSDGVWGWEIGNEANNPREHPPGQTLTPADVAATYNAIRARVPGARLSPGALDPFNAQCGDPRDWLAGIYSAIAGAEFVAAHGYIRGPDPALLVSTARFTDPPLQWQGLNFPLCVEALLAALPASYWDLPVYITEFNHLWKTIEPDWGWVTDARAGQVVTAACSVARARGWSLALYRWDGDAWSLRSNTAVLEALRDCLA